MKWKSGTQLAFWMNVICLALIALWSMIGASIYSNQLQWPPHPIIGIFAIAGIVFLLIGVIAQED